MVSNRTDYAREIAPDFIPTEDIISVTDPTNLLETYIESNARLIIIGENINESYKQALIKVKRFDKFVRMMVVPSIDHSNLDHFFKQMALVYNSDRW
jgi:pentose-5-phosphate-3-epimerase